MTEPKHLKVREESGVSVVSFATATALDAYHVNDTAKDLYQLVEEQQLQLIVLDLSSVMMLSSQSLGVFLNMQRKLEPGEGKIAISGLNPRLYRVFKITNLQSVFEFHENEK